MQSGDSHDFSTRVAGMIQQGDFFEPAQPVWITRAPGRLDLFGGNVDYTGGLVLQLPVREAVCAAAQLTAQPLIRIFNPGAAEFGWETTLELPLAALSDLQAIESLCRHSPRARWGHYVLGGFHFLQQRYGCFANRGAHLLLVSNLPPNRGLASSAALEVATLKAAATAAGIALGGVALAQAAQWVENVVAHSACGIMDQAAIVLGQEGCLLPLRCQPCVPFPLIRLPEQLCVWGIDSMVSRATNSSAYETARAAAFMGYKIICEWEGLPLVRDSTAACPRWADERWDGYLSNLSPSTCQSRYGPRLPDSISGRDFLHLYGGHVDPFTSVNPDATYPVRAAVRYATEENQRIEIAESLLGNLDLDHFEDTLRLLGELMFQSHSAYAECGLGAEACDELVALARGAGFFGAKMTGGGAGGVVAVLGFAHQQDRLQQLVASYGAKQGAVPRVFAGSSDGADLFGAQCVAVPVAAEVR